MQIAYIVIDWGTPDLASACRESILQHRPDGTIIEINAKALGLGYAQACNLGLSMAVEPYVCFLNADTAMLEDDAPVLDLLERSAAIVGVRQVDAGGRIVHGGIVADEDIAPSEWALELRHRGWGQPLEMGSVIDQITETTIPVPTVAGSVLYARRDVLELIGGWWEGSLFYYEDTELCYRARSLNHVVLYTGAVTWRHYHASSPVKRGWRDRQMRVARAAFIERCAQLGIQLDLTQAELL